MTNKSEKLIETRLHQTDSYDQLYACIKPECDKLVHRGQIVIKSQHHSIEQICSAIRQTGLYVFEETKVDDGETTVVARKITPVKPGKPAHVGSAGGRRI